MTRLRRLGRLAGHLLFWGWNLWLLALVWFGVGPLVAWQLLGGVVKGLIPWSFAAVVAALLSLPPAALALGLWRLRADPGRLLSLLYGVQGPLMVACLARLFAFGPLTAPTALALGVTFAGAAALLRTLLAGPAEASAPAQVVRLAAHAAWMVALLWVAVVLALIAAPLVSEAPWLAFELLGDVARSPFDLLGPTLLSVGFLLGTVAMLALWPVAAVGVGIRGFEVVHRATAQRIGAPAAGAVSAAVVVGVLGAFAAASRQPQGAAFATLAAATDDAGRRAALDRAEAVRDGLLAARLGPDRLLEVDVDDLGAWTARRFGLGGSAAAAVWTAALAPFRYRPVHAGSGWTPRGAEPIDVARATEAYAAFFDLPIEVGERAALLAAARQTWAPDQAQAGLLDVGGQKVRLAGQDWAIERHGDVARVTLHDEYRNLTFDPQEVLVAFSLPESAAITGLWLGSEPRREAAFPFVVAPRGAAQEVYEGEVRVRRDPALLEQVGPRQYRLRAFPVPARSGGARDLWTAPDEGEALHLWLELVVPVVDGPDGAPVVPLPDVAEVRNLTLEGAGPRTLDGAPLRAAGWAPEPVAAVGGALRAHRVRLGAWDVVAAPAGPAPVGRLGSVVVFVDGTRSMAAHAAEVDAALARLRAVADRVEPWCVVEDQPRPCPDFAAVDALFYGATPLAARLAALAPQLPADAALVVLTDRRGDPPAAAAPLPDVGLPETWLVHLDGLPAAHPDWILDRLIRSGGGAVASVDEMLARRSRPDVVDGWRFALLPAELTAPADTGPFSAVAARRAVALLASSSPDHRPEDLDRLHAIAVEHHVVTAWSSLLVLVDDAQRRALAAAEGRADRFDREAIDGPPEVVAVPEPSTWLLLALGGLVAGGARRRRRDPGATAVP